MGREGELWDDSSLIKAFDDAIFKYKKMHGKGSKEKSNDFVSAANEDDKSVQLTQAIVSVHDYNLPSFLLQSAYFTGKRKAESEVLSLYPNSGVVLRPAFIYGKRWVDGFEIPLDLIGEPWEKILEATQSLAKPLNALPASDLVLAPPISVDDLALAAVSAVRDDEMFGIFTVEQIKQAAVDVKV